MRPVFLVPVSLSMLSLATLIGTVGVLTALSSLPLVVRRLHKALPYSHFVLTALWFILR